MNNFAPRTGDFRNAEGYCRTCGLPLGIGGDCAACALEDMERKARDFLKTRTFLDGLTGLAAYVAADMVEGESETVTIPRSDYETLRWLVRQIAYYYPEHGTLSLDYVFAGDDEQIAHCREIVEREG